MLSWISMAQRTASTALGNSARTASPGELKPRPSAMAMKSSVADRHDAIRRSVSSSSSATNLPYSAMWATRIAAILRFIGIDYPKETDLCQFLHLHDVKFSTNAGGCLRGVARYE